MAEEHGFQAPESRNLCRNNCGFFGSAATENFCSKCYRDFFMKDGEQQSKLESFGYPAASQSVVLTSSSAVYSPESADGGKVSGVETVVQAAKPVVQANRCSVCRRRVGLTGFKCRCGTTFCGTHRYPEQHGCTFDFKTMGRDAIAKANPLIKADKLEKI